MSLLVDGDYAIYQLRLAYLRRVDDHYGPRVLSFADITDLPPTAAASSSSSAAPGGSGGVPRRSSHIFGAGHHANNSSASSSTGSAASGAGSGLGAFSNGHGYGFGHANGNGSGGYGVSNGGSGSGSGSGSGAGAGERRSPALTTLPPLAPDSHIVMAGLNSARYQPELANVYSPLPHADLPPGAAAAAAAAAAASGSNSASSSSAAAAMGPGGANQTGVFGPNRLGGAEQVAAKGDNKNAGGLRYTTTIYGPGRTGAMGMRVSGRRAPSEEGQQRRSKARAGSMPKPAEEGSDAKGFAFPPTMAAAGAGAGAGAAPSTSEGDSGSSSSMQIPALAVQGSTYDSSLDADPMHGAVSGDSRSDLATATALKGAPKVPRRRSSSHPQKISSAAGTALERTEEERVPKSSDASTVQTDLLQKQQQQQSGQPGQPGLQTPKTARQHKFDWLDRTPPPTRPARSVRRASSVRENLSSVGGAADDDGVPRGGPKTLERSKSISDVGRARRSTVDDDLGIGSSTLQGQIGEEGEEGEEEKRRRSDAFKRHLEQQRDSVGSDGTAREAAPSSSSRRGTLTSEGRSSSYDFDTYSERGPSEMGRTESNSTIFSLASPPQTRPRALSDRRANETLHRSKTFGPLHEVDETAVGGGATAGAGRGAGGFSFDGAMPSSAAQTMPVRGNLYGQSESSISPLSKENRLLYPHDQDGGASSIGDTTSSAARSFVEEEGSTVSSLDKDQQRGVNAAGSSTTASSVAAERGRRRRRRDQGEDENADGDNMEGVEDIQGDKPLLRAGSSARAEADAAPIRTALGLEMGNGAIDGETDEPAVPALHPPGQAISSRAVTPNALEVMNPASAVAKKRSRRELKNGHAIELQNQWFASLKKPVVPVRRQSGGAGGNVSALSALLRTRSDGPTNAFTQLYKGVAGSSVSGGSSTNVEIYFPLAKSGNSTSAPGGKTRSGALQLNGKKRSMTLNVRRDATMEELIGYSLYCYVEEGWKPALDEGLAEDVSEEDRGVRLSSLGWTLRIVEDGEVDDDYPAIDRSLQVGKFGADELAICEATQAQIKQHLASVDDYHKRASTTQSTVLYNAPPPQQVFNQQQQSLKPPTATPAKAPELDQRQLQNPSTMPPGPSARLAATAGNAPAGSLVSVQGTPIFTSSTLSRSSAAGPTSAPIFLRVLITPNDQVRYKTTLQVPSDMYLADVLETICKKRHLADAEHWALVVPDRDDTVVPLDRTVESLQGNHDLALVRRSTLDLPQGGRAVLNGQSTNPNASIFKRLGGPGAVDDAGQTKLLLEQSGQQGARLYNSTKDITSTYKSYTVNRKMPSFLGRHERILTIDGDWLHIIPTDTRAFYNTHSATASFPIGAVVSCKQQSRIASNFKLIVARENDQKRYDFEAENARLAAEIVQEINSLLKKP